MLSPSVRRAVSAAPQSPIVSSLGAALPRVASSYVLSYKRTSCHQRRHSSSKPSSPDNGPKDLSTGQSVATSAQSKPAEAKTENEKRKRKAKDRSSATRKLPSVPSTQHLSQDDLSLTTFFSLHRPISVTHCLPKAVSEDAFASIFTPKSTAQKRAEVISSLSKTVADLEDPMAKLSLAGHQDAEPNTAENVTKIELRHPDGSESSVYVQLNAMNGQFLPFRPPPAPDGEAAGAAKSDTAEASAEDAAAADEAPQRRVYKAVFTIEETTDQDGQIKVMAHSPQLIEETAASATMVMAQPRTFLERMALRQLRWEESSRAGQVVIEDAVVVGEEGESEGIGGEGMLAISVKRQRKLKMKKKKYKKLMRRTRNERRRLQRI